MLGIIELHEIIGKGETKKVKSFRFSSFKEAEEKYDKYIHMLNCARIKNYFTHTIEIYEKENGKRKLRAIMNAPKSVAKYILKDK
jgi:hypothetical protein